MIDRITLWQTSARHVTVQPNRLLLPTFSSYLTSDFYSEIEMLKTNYSEIKYVPPYPFLGFDFVIDFEKNTCPLCFNGLTFS